MTSHADIAVTLREAMTRRAMTQAQLCSTAGVSQRTLTHVLSGAEDYKLSTLLAVADRLGLRLVLLPEQASSGVAPQAAGTARVRTRVQAATERAQGTGEAGSDGR